MEVRNFIKWTKTNRKKRKKTKFGVNRFQLWIADWIVGFTILIFGTDLTKEALQKEIDRGLDGE